MVTQTNAQLCYTLTRFMSVVVHTLLHHRQCYPSRSFILARAYDHPVRQSRHPVLSAWIEDAIDAVYTQLLAGTLARAALVICNTRTGAPLERFVFDFGQLPRISAVDANTLFVREGQTVDLENGGEQELDPIGPEELDLSESLRAVLSKLSSLGGRLDPIPPGCTFTVSVELKGEAEIEDLNGRDDADDDDDKEASLYDELYLPAEKDDIPDEELDVSNFKPDDTRRTQPWILARPGRFRRHGTEEARVVPIRSVNAGELVFEVWAEERPAAKRAAREAPSIPRPRGLRPKADAEKGKTADATTSAAPKARQPLPTKPLAKRPAKRQAEGQESEQATAQTNEKTDEHTNEQMNEQMNEQTNEQTTEQTTEKTIREATDESTEQTTEPASPSGSKASKRVRFADNDG